MGNEVKFWQYKDNALAMDKVCANLLWHAIVNGADEPLFLFSKWNPNAFIEAALPGINGAAKEAAYNYIRDNKQVWLYRKGNVYYTNGYYSRYSNGYGDIVFNPWSGASRRFRQDSVESMLRDFGPFYNAMAYDDDYESVNKTGAIWRYAADKIHDSYNMSAADLKAFFENGCKFADPAPAAPVAAPVKKEEVMPAPAQSNALGDMLAAALADTIAKAAVDDMLPRIKDKIVREFGCEPVIHKVVDVTSGRSVKLDGVVHKSFDAVLHFVRNNVPVFMYGPAGSGKGCLCEQVAKALGLDYYFMNSVTDEFKVNGFVDVNGVYNESPFYKAFTKGGLFFLDEMDASAPEVLVCLNAAIANRYFSFPEGHTTDGRPAGGFKKAHEDFRVVAAGNTLGTGADAAYTGRMQLDAASLNRFVVVPVDYDENIDLFNADGDTELVAFAKAYRKAAKKCGLFTVCSYRNLKQIKVAEVMGLESALLFCLAKELNKDDINILAKEVCMSEPNNRYAKAFKNVEPMVC